ncbi:MAG: recombinase family protein [Lachnospiraceae bacterium]|nr:recombinase family protein [Lachnospiraceae bacterium]
MIYGYARVSTKGQAKDGNGLEAQEKALRSAGVTKIYMDAFTGTKSSRPELDKLLGTMQDGDTLVVTKLDRIARSATQGMELIQTLLDRGVTVHVLNMGLMDSTPTGKLIRNVMLAFAEFERDMIVERTCEGKAVAKQRKDFREGRPRKYSHVQMEHALSLLESNSYKQVEQMTGISKSTLLRAKRREESK